MAQTRPPSLDGMTIVPKALHLFPDTNLFVQCRPLVELGWDQWSDYSEVLVIVCRAVQTEIDQHKNRGNDRLARRARATSSQFRDLILGTAGLEIVRKAGPSVRLKIMPDLRPSKELEDRLDYSDRDNQLVGTIAAYVRDHPGLDVRLLTDDTGPMATARMVGVSVAPIPDSWLLPPEPTGADRRIAKLEAELSRLKQDEPCFRITCRDARNNEIERISEEQSSFEPLSDEEVSALLTRLTTEFPLVNDFRPDVSDFQMAIQSAAGFEFVGPTKEEISTYGERSYPTWIADCEKVLRTCHRQLQIGTSPPMFRFSVANVGTKPGRDVLWTVTASGKLTILPPFSSERRESLLKLKLPSPPTAPAGSWQPVFRGLLTDRALEYVSREIRYPKVLDNLVLPSNLGTARRDPNGYYWKPERPTKRSQHLALECQQWRHGDHDELFEGEIYLPNDSDDVSGSLECRIQAANLSTPTTLRVPVRVVATRVSAYTTAKRLVDELIDDRQPSS